MLLACAGVAVAQDSVSRNANGGSGLPGDALSPWATGVGQRATYVVDLRSFQTSGRTTFGIAPLIKSPRVNATRFNMVNGPTAISGSLQTGINIPAGPYSFWSQAGGGLSVLENDAALNSPISPTGTGTGFGLAVLDFDEQPIAQNLIFTNVIHTSRVAFDPAQPDRLYVNRVIAAVNGAQAQPDRSQFGLGAVDLQGNVIFRADSFNATGPTTSLIQGDNYFRIVHGARSSTSINLIDNAGGSNGAATTWLLQRSPLLHSVPNLVGERTVGATFNGALALESTFGTVSGSTASHRPSTIDHRGGAATSVLPIWSGTTGSGAIVTRSTTGGGKADTLSVFGFDNVLNVLTARSLTLPASISDACDGFNWPLAGGDFRQYDSQQVFRGGASAAAVGRDLAGNGLVAATLYNGSQLGSNNPLNAIAVARFNPTNAAAPQWTLAAWVATTGSDGKDLIGDNGADGAPNTNDAGENDGVVNNLDAPIGRLASLSEAGTGLVGPSISAPAFDAAGNVYFIASVALKKRPGVVVIDDYQTALVRGVLNPATLCYTLEVVVATGDTFIGRNSNRPYRISYLGLADGDSIASSAVWSTSVVNQPWNNIANAALPQNAPQHVGGIALSARVIYDVDQNGQFLDPTAVSGNQNSVDEAYNVALYIGNITLPAGCDTIDFNNNSVFPEDQDVIDFFNVLAGSDCPACNDIDFNNNGVFPEDQDVIDFFNVLAGGECSP
ncbi:MAG TPA: hypothetical protein VK157_13270 [Phycisphaerales bacterium]|nr:hypothetical protein [Phycisphaerales bacterium]